MSKNHGQPPNNTGKTYKRNVYDPRVDIFKQFYLRPDSYTFFNIRQSALRAGYSEQYANNISTQQPKWWKELQASSEFTRAKMLHAAENNLYEYVSEPTPTDASHKRIQADVSKYVTERLGKEHYSSRQEMTGADGRRLFDSSKRDLAAVPLAKLFKPAPKS
jgi:hypothetical protein